MSDCLRGSFGQRPAEQNGAFALTEGVAIELIDEGALTSQRGRFTLVETAIKDRLGVEILQESYVDRDAEHMDGIFLKVTLRNVGRSGVEDLYAGLFFDRDIGVEAAEFARWGVDSKMGNVMPEASGADSVVGTKALSGEGSVSNRAIDNE